MIKKYIPLSFLLLNITITALGGNTNKPISAQYGFIENKGQIIDQHNKPNPHVLYLYNGNGLHVQLRKDGFSYEAMNLEKTPKAVIDITPTSKFASQVDSFDITYQTHRVDINFKGGNKSALLKPYAPASDYINYYTTATPEEGVTHVRHFQKVVYENVYPNIDVEFVLNDATNKGKFKYNFIVKPHANLADIQLEFVGANRTSLTKEGNILIETAYGNLEENIPLSYVINKDNSHSSIKATFTALASNIFGITAADYNHNQTLVIDPINWATYYGGNHSEMANAVTKDTSGNIVIVGQTNSTNAIATSGAHQAMLILGGNQDAFIAKFNSNGIRQWATYYGGNEDDFGYGITTDVSGNIAITGETLSSSIIATSGAYQTIYGGGNYGDAFIAKFNNNGIRQWETYYGGNGNEIEPAIATDNNGNVIITGVTGSGNAIATVGAHQTIFGGGYDAFIAKFNTNGIRQWATYYGTSDDDWGYGITTDASGNIIITGKTSGNNSIATVGAHQTIIGGFSDVFIAKFNSTGVRQWATYYGGMMDDRGFSITTDAVENIIITGQTSSPNAIATSGSYQANYGGGFWDVFVAKFNAIGIRQWASYCGGNGSECASAVSTDGNGNIVISGFTNSTNTIATIGSHQSSYGGGVWDAFIAKFNTNGIRQWGTYYGGTSQDCGTGVTTDVGGNIIIVGFTSSTAGLTTNGTHQTVFGGDNDAFVAKFTSNGMLPVKLIVFNAVLANDKVNCTWETASEINNDFFTIERSVDGDDFESIGTIKGKGNSSVASHYNFTDYAPLAGTSYYRLNKLTLMENTPTAVSKK